MIFPRTIYYVAFRGCPHLGLAEGNVFTSNKYDWLVFDDASRVQLRPGSDGVLAVL